MDELDVQQPCERVDMVGCRGKIPDTVTDQALAAYKQLYRC
jgi:hypothetical protein